MFLAALTFVTPASAAPGDLTNQLVGNWTVRCSTDNSGAFSHCTMMTVYNAKNAKERRQLRGKYMELWFAQNSSDLRYFTMMLHSADWRVTQRDYRVKLVFSDGTYKLNCRGDGEDLIKCQFELKGDREIWQDISEKSGVSVWIDGHNLGGLSLGGSRRALAFMMSQYNKHSSGADSFSGGTFSPRQGNVDPNETF